MPSEKPLLKKLDEMNKKLKDLADLNESLKKNLASLRREYVKTKKEVHYINNFLTENLEEVYTISVKKSEINYKEIYRLGEENARNAKKQGWYIRQDRDLGFTLKKKFRE